MGLAIGILEWIFHKNVNGNAGEKSSAWLITYYRWLQINKNGARNVLSCSSFAEKGVERIVSASNGLVARHLAIRLNSMLQAIQFPTSIANLHSGLSNVNWDALTLKEKENELENRFKVTREWRCLLTVPRAKLSNWRRVVDFTEKNLLVKARQGKSSSE